MLPRNWNFDEMLRYSIPPLKVCAPRVSVAALANESDRGSNFEPMVEDALVARISSPLRAMPVVPRASIDDEVNAPDSDTPVGS